MNNDILTGKTKEHFIFDEAINRYFHKDIYEDFLKLKARAKEDGFDLYVTSSFRGFDDQLRIWNEKAQGKRKLFNDNGEELDFKKLREREVLDSILRWSAIPGASRHHWGTDLDVVDKLSWPKDYHVQLTPQEFSEGGPFHNFSLWLSRLIKEEKGLGFFRPYENDLGGVAPEMWHISHVKQSNKLMRSYTLDVFRNHIEEHIEEIALSDLLLENIDFYYENYFTNIKQTF